MRSSQYDSSFYASQVDGSITSAKEVLKTVRDLLHPKSVVDVGCGLGTWLRVWSELGVEDILGIDGDYVQRDRLLISRDKFKPMDLSDPTGVNVKFELVQCLEIAEHLPENTAEAFVSFLCSLGPVVLFSAAIPHQGGTNHVNEQWPEYWAELFLQKGFVAIDAIRNRIWHNPNIESWYRQNILIFVQAEQLKKLEELKAYPVVPAQKPLSRVHPCLWLEINEKPLQLRKCITMLLRSVVALPSRGVRKLKRDFTK